MAFEFFLQDLNHLSSDSFLLVIHFKLIALFARASATNRTDVDHAVATLNVDAGLDWDVEVVDVLLAEVAETLELLFA